MKIIKYALRKIFVSVFLIYSVNLILVNFNFVIPINYFNIGFVTILGFPGLIGLLIFRNFL